jgi:acetyl-CoA C-acetyltransferase
VTERVAILGMARTAIGRFGGSLGSFDSTELGALVVRAAVQRSGLELADIERLVAGENIQVTRRGNPARPVLLKAGIPAASDDYAINMNCASGLRAMTALAQDLLLGDVEVGVAVGMETMSRTPYLLEGARWGYRFGNGEMIDYLADYILGDAGPMAEAVAARCGVTREDQDRFAAQSQARAIDAIDAGRFVDDIVPVEVPQPRGDPVLFQVDEHPRRDTSLERLAKLKPAFQTDGTVTAGNSSGINDGAAGVVLALESTAKRRGLPARAYLKAWTAAGVEPGLFGLGPVPATRKLLKRTGLGIDDLDLIELNEAFAAQALACDRELHFDRERVNVNGGAIALGHPIGATGARIVVTLLHEMRRRQAKRGLATLCVSGGMGFALLLERV